MTDGNITAKRCPQQVFDLFLEDPETARAQAMDWLLSQPRGNGQVYVIPHPETGRDMHVQAPVVH